MNVVDFLFKTTLFGSRGEIGRAIKNNAVSIDFEKVKNSKLEVNFDFENIRVFHVGKILSGSKVLENKGEPTLHGAINMSTELHDDEKGWVKLCKRVGFIANFKTSNELFEVAFRDLIVVHKSKKEMFLVKIF